MGDSTFSLGPLASSTYTLYYSPLRVQSHQGSVTFSADAVGQFWYRLDLRADPCPPVRYELKHIIFYSQVTFFVRVLLLYKRHGQRTIDAGNLKKKWVVFLDFQ